MQSRYFRKPCYVSKDANSIIMHNALTEIRQEASLALGYIFLYVKQVTKKFPGVSVMVEMEALKSPYIQITPDKINFHAEGEMLLYADVTLLGKVSLFKLKVVSKTLDPLFSHSH